MMRVVSLFVVLALGACDPAVRPWTSEGPDVEAIRAAEVLLAAAVADRNEAAVLAHYHDDAQVEHVLPAGEGALSAHASYRELFAGDASGLEYQPTRIEASQRGDLAASYGECTIIQVRQTHLEPVSHDASCVKLWRPDKDGRWRIAREIREAGAP